MKLLYILIIAIAVAVIYWWMLPAKVFCGGFAGIKCPTFLYTCKSEGISSKSPLYITPDAGVNCIKIFTK